MSLCLKFGKILLVFCLLVVNLFANQDDSNDAGDLFLIQGNKQTDIEKINSDMDSNKNPSSLLPLAIVVPTFAAITAFGITSWDWELYKIHQGDLKWDGEDGWFGEDTGYGGADKLGHMYSTMLISNGLIESMKYAGYSNDTSAIVGSLTAFLIMAYVEVGDATAAGYGFEPADTVFNGLGALMSYVFYKYPRVNDFIDYRLEYEITQDLWLDLKAIGSTYETQKYNLVFQMSGFKGLQYNTGPTKYLEYLEFGAQYYVKGFESDTMEKQRNLKFVVGFNAPLGIKRLNKNNYKAVNATSKFFNYVQMPYTYVGAGKQF